MAKILITDDSQFMRHLIEDILLEKGNEVFHAGDGQEMLDVYEEVKPDVVLVDIVMPVLDGMSAIGVLHQKYPEAKIIMCSALGQEDMIKESEAKGAIDFIRKPFNVEQIIETVEKALK